MKIIKDIRLFKSVVENIDGNSLPLSIGNKKLNVITHRIVMKLREGNFSLGDVDHLYLNFTLCLDEGDMQSAQRSPDPYHPWCRWLDIGIDQKLYDALETDACINDTIFIIEKVLLHFYAPHEVLNSSIFDIANLSEDMLMLYKEKKAAKTRAVIYLRYLDSGEYLPLLCIYDLEEKELLRKDLPATIDLNYIGEIQLSSKKVTVNSRKNVFAKNLKPISFDF